MKTCTNCGKSQEINEFAQDRNRVDGRDPHCKTCKRIYYDKNIEKLRGYARGYYENNTERRKEYSRKYRKDNPEKIRVMNREMKLKYAYGMSHADYEEMLSKQGGVCAACGRPPRGKTSRTNKLYIDHDHENGMVRGLLCHGCNSALGYSKEDISILNRLIDYIANFQR